MRKIISISLLFTSVAALALFVSMYSPADLADDVVTTTHNKPNFVFILADDLDIGMSEYWDRVDNLAGTALSNCDQSKVIPNFMTCDPLRKTRELIKDQGITFTNAFVTTSLCCSSRASIETGMYAHNTGVITNGGDIGGYGAFVQHGYLNKTTAVHLQQEGYRTGFMGKYLNGISDVKSIEGYPTGWDDIYVDNSDHLYAGYNYKLFERSKEQLANGDCPTVESCTITYYNRPNDYGPDVIADKALVFLDDVIKNPQPFFLYVAPTVPHLPLIPAVRHGEHPYFNAKITRAFWPNYLEEDVSDKPEWLQRSVYAREETLNIFNDIDYQYRQGSLYALDDLVEKIVKKLEENGLLENTYIVFASDNGYNLGAHYLMHKMSPYEESIRVPLVARGPGIPKGEFNDNLVLALDLPVTFLDLAGLNTSNYDGQSLKTLFKENHDLNWRTDFISEYVLGSAANGIGEEVPPALWVLVGQDVPSYRAVRTDNFIYIAWYHGEDLASWNESKGQLVWDVNRLITGEELYNLEEDPFQLDNLLSKENLPEACRVVVNILKQRLEALSACKGAACHEPFPYPKETEKECIEHLKH